jgi:lysophospholipase L1-like esterase
VKNALLLLGTLVAVAAMLEGGARWLDVRPPRVDVETREPSEEPGARLAIRRRTATPLIVQTGSGARLRPNSVARIEEHPLSGFDFTIKTNGQGFRHPPLGAKADGETRVLFLGDSITFGGYLPAWLTIPAFTAKELRASRAVPEPFQVINAAIGGLDAENELAILVETGASVQPDVVLVGLYLNDAFESLYLRSTRLPDALAWSDFLAWSAHRVDLLRQDSLARGAEGRRGRELARDLALFRERFPVSDEPWETHDGGFNRRVEAAFHDWGYAWSDAYWTKIARTLELMRGVTREQGARLAVVLFPVRYQVERAGLRDEPQREFASLMAELELPHLDLLPELRAHYADGGVDLFYDYCHYRPEGTAFVGERIAAFLADEVL